VAYNVHFIKVLKKWNIVEIRIPEEKFQQNKVRLPENIKYEKYNWNILILFS